MHERSLEKGVDIHVLKGHEVTQKEIFLPQDTTIHLEATDPSCFLRSGNTPRFQQKSIIAPQGPEIAIKAYENYGVVSGTKAESGSFLQKVAWKTKELTPRASRSEIFYGSFGRWEMDFGYDPNKTGQIVMRDREDVLEVQFNGHPDQLIKLIMDEHTDEENLETCSVSFIDSQANPTKDIVHSRTICSPTLFKATFTHEHYNKQTAKNDPFSFKGQGMAYVEIKKGRRQKKDLPHTNIRLSVATRALADQKLRIYHTEWTSLLYHGHIKLTRAERISLCMQYAQALEELSHTDFNTIDFPLNQFERIAFNCLEAPEPHELSGAYVRFETIWKLLPKDNTKRKKKK